MANKVIAVVGARLNSSRLPRKHLLPLAGEPLIAHIFHRLAAVPGLDKAVLATTADSYNQDLVSWAAAADVACYAHEGDVNDLMGRVDAVVRREEADMVLYVCGDSPLIEPVTLQGLINTLKQDESADLVQLAAHENDGVPIHCGFDLYRRSFWDQMMMAATEPFEREHVGAVSRHSGKVKPRSIAFFQDDPAYARIGHRISVDTGQDYKFMKQIYADWYSQHDQKEPVDLLWVIDRLLSEPELRAINADVHQRRPEEVPPHVTLLTEAGPDIGLGHLVRTCVAASSLQTYLGAKVHVVVRGTPVDFEDLSLLPHSWVEDFSGEEGRLGESDSVILDLKAVDADCETLLRNLPASTVKVGIDFPLDHAGLVDLCWMPSIHVPEAVQKHFGDKLAYGPDCFLLRPTPKPYRAKHEGKSVLVLTGGSDPAHLSETLPAKLLAAIPQDVRIDWVQGPYADPPVLPGEGVPLTRWRTLKAPDNLNELLAGYDAVLCVYGVSFYECQQAGVPTVVFDAIGAAKPDEWKVVSDMFPSLAVQDVEAAVDRTVSLLVEDNSRHDLTLADRLKQAPEHFARKVAALIAERGKQDA
ncbi:cytidylyltransferase domain-containing protein [Kordiimonas marina]|uniref:cytidylyltransferase domain-containing protein n=1 Tax=Kordiimonas marina TaxID=2872312 RepID=UPI001FF62E46|nr:NTP transferase domain-containing protein [Kordiimonas marina]MCJ9430318.1 NTP transferase domain-containing protein [Kordiimonas marina]